MNIRFYNARILTMEEEKGKECDLKEIFKGVLYVQDDKITYVGAEDCAEQIQWDREIDCKGNVLMPGFKNAHTHSAMTAMRTYADGLPLKEWLFEKIFPLEAKLTADDIKTFTKLSILEYLTSGVTSVLDMYMKSVENCETFIDMGMRYVQSEDVNMFGPTLDVVEERYNFFKTKHPLVSSQLGFHAEYTCDKELLEKLSEMAHKYKAPMYVHISETKNEVDECIGRYGMTPPVFLDSLGMFDFGGGGYHCVHFTDEDIEVFKKHNVSVIQNPGSNVKLASGIGRTSDYLKAGLNVALGTDGPSSNNCLDMFKEMMLITGLAKLHDNDASAVDALEVLKMATKNGAIAMGLNDCDTLTKGKQADIVMIDLHQPNMQPFNDIARNIVYSGSKTNVKMTMVAGKVLYEDGKFFVGVDPEDVYDEVNETKDKLLKLL